MLNFYVDFWGKKMGVGLFIFSGVFHQKWLFSTEFQFWLILFQCFKKDPSFIIFRSKCLSLSIPGPQANSLCVWEQWAKGSKSCMRCCFTWVSYMFFPFKAGIPLFYICGEHSLHILILGLILGYLEKTHGISKVLISTG